MLKELSNQNLTVQIDQETGCAVSLCFTEDQDGMNWLIAPEVLKRYGYQDDERKLLGKSYIRYTGGTLETEHLTPEVVENDARAISFRNTNGDLRITHSFFLEENSFGWRVSVENIGDTDLVIDRMYHWMPIHYVMHENLADNLHQSCSFVPSVSGNQSYMICRKRSGQGPDLVVVNTGGGLRSTGSLCRYKNLFFEKSAPSLSGLVFFNAVNTYAAEKPDTVDWQYRDMAQPIDLRAGEVFEDSFRFCVTKPEALEETLLAQNLPVFDYQPVTLCGRETVVAVCCNLPVTGYELSRADEHRVLIEQKGVCKASEGTRYLIKLSPCDEAGERQLKISFVDGATASITFAVYQSMREMVEAFCGWIYQSSFISDPNDKDYCGYRSISRQGEACAKGSLLLMKNLLGGKAACEIHQVERNAVNYLRKRWLDENFVAMKQYPGGFARIIDMDYLILEFYLLSLFEDEYLALNTADTYLIWAYRTAAYRFEVTPDKLPREAVEVELASMISWLQIEMMERLEHRGFTKQAAQLRDLWQRHIAVQMTKGQTYVETEHYFDNAGISVYAETLFNNGDICKAVEAAELLLANVAPSTDYRNYAPDRWWEALAPMYHNLWAAFSAKAMLSAYEKTGRNCFLQSAYRAMMPMFYNYDWMAVSAPNRFDKGRGVSAYCLTSPNLNIELASRNRFGQSIFKDDFFSQMDIAGDDWDLGADMVVYLSTFGQKCYMIEEKGAYLGVNCVLEQHDADIRVISNAAYPTTYWLAPLKMEIRHAVDQILIRSITIQGDECIELELSGTPVPQPVEILVNGHPIDMHPSIIWSKG